MEHLNVEIRWSDKNFCGGVGFPGIGAVMVTNKTLSGFKQEFEETLRWHIDEMIAAGEALPEWAASGDYAIDYTLHTSALLR